MKSIFSARSIAGAFLFFGVLLITGCGLFNPNLNYRSLPVEPRSASVEVPFFAQDRYECGPAGLAMALNWSGVEVSPDDLVPLVYTPEKKGTLQPAMVAATRHHGRLAFTFNGIDTMLKQVAAGYPVVVLQNLGLSWVPKWHYAVVHAYDLDSGHVTLHSGITENKLTDWKVFIRTWKRGKYWGLVVLPPGKVPVSVSQEDYLRSVLGLEQVKNWDGAILAYEAALEKWEDSFGALMGLGNSRFAMGDINGAEQAFQEANTAYPQNTAVLNNLAFVQAKRGNFEAALANIREAEALGGDLLPVVQQTRSEILEMMTAVPKKN